MMTKSCFFLGEDAAFPIFSPPPVLEKDAPVSSLLSFWPGKSHRSPGERGEGTGEDAKWAVKLETHAEGGGGGK